jgi:predicted kinase
VALNRGIYGPAATAKIYEALARAAEKEVLAGNGAILDATFGRKSQRMRMARLAAAYKVPFIVIHCSTSEAATALRLRLRAAQGTDVSAARWHTYVAHKAAYEPLDELTPERVLELETDAPLEELIRSCERFCVCGSLKQAIAVMPGENRNPERRMPYPTSTKTSGHRSWRR